MICCSVIAGFSLHFSKDFWDGSTKLTCGPEAMQFSVSSVSTESPFVWRALDHKGKALLLHNSSACGLWVRKKSDTAVHIKAAYDGCFVREKNGDHVMTVIMEDVNRKVELKDLKCPLMPAMDAPAPGVCTAVARQDRLSCTEQSDSKEICERLGCCFNPSDPTMSCYFGKPLTAQCTDSSVQVAISAALTMPSLILDSVHVLDVTQTSCPGMRVSKTNQFISIHFPLSCSPMNQMPGGTILYENTIGATQDVRTLNRASITRDSTMRVTIRCTYSSTGIAPLQLQVFTLPPPLPVSTTGPLLLEMRIARDLQYSSYYSDGDYPVQKVLRDPVYLEVRILQKTDPSLVLIVNDCWANPSLAATQQPQWPILEHSCPFLGDNYLTQLVPPGVQSLSLPFPSHYKRFSISTFTFVDGRTQHALGGLVYFHCSATVCVPSTTDSCTPSCLTRKKRRTEVINPGEMLTVTSDGPVDFTTAKSDYTSTGNLGSEDSSLTIVRGAVAIGILLAGVIIAVMCVHHRHAPKTYNVTV
uniref:Zona pellucida sperm-binding protein 4 n=1 Tax=Leptobrachium leishanense TaxID=445787 RepID=A0A8C5MI92_9ANUR